MSISRIYQGLINLKNSAFVNKEINISVSDALMQTHSLYQDAVNYHILAMAGMASYQSEADDSIGSRFSERIRSIWTEHPKGNPSATTLQQSIARTLTLRNPSFDEAVSALFDGCACPEHLPHVLELIMLETEKGTGAIQQKGRELLPKLCDSSFKGTFLFSDKQKQADEKKRQLMELLNSDFSQEELEDFSNGMDLSWAGIKTQTGKYKEVSEKTTDIIEALDEIKNSVTNQSDARILEFVNEHYSSHDDFYAEISDARARLESMDLSTPLARNSKAAKPLKWAAIFFIYFPNTLSANLLRIRLGKPKKAKTVSDTTGLHSLDNDPIILCRGERGYVYLGYSALPCWETGGDANMYSKEWDVAAFKEALKAVHGFELKMKERRDERAQLESKINFMESGKGNMQSSVEGDDDEESSRLPIFAGDERFTLLNQLSAQLCSGLDKDTEAEEYSISRRAIKGIGVVMEKWKNLIAEGLNNQESLVAATREAQAELQDKFGSAPLFEALAHPDYHAIWAENEEALSQRQAAGQSKRILIDYCQYQSMKQDSASLAEPVRITAAEPNYSARLMMFSDISNLGGSAASAYGKTKNDQLDMMLVVLNNRGRWEAQKAEIIFSAPRAERDRLEIGRVGAPCLQPMMRSLLGDEAEAYATLERAAAVSLLIKSTSHGSIHVWLNFAASIDVEPLHKKLGKAELWASQHNGVAKDLSSLHWPGTYSAKPSPWWDNKTTQQNGFTVLGIDLGVRYAAAWSRIAVSAHEASSQPTKPSQRLGTIDQLTWYGSPIKDGIIRLDGEGKSTMPKLGRASGIRQADSREIEEAKALSCAFGSELTWLNDASVAKHLNILELNRALVEKFHRYLSRYSSMLSWAYRIMDENKQDATMPLMEAYLSYGNQAQQYPYVQPLLTAISDKNIHRVQTLLLDICQEMQSNLPKLAEQTMTLALPRKRGRWAWIPESLDGWVGSGRMTVVDSPIKESRKCYDAGGLSMGRIELLEKLRRTLQSLNRLLSVTPGTKPQNGRAAAGLKVTDPCVELREKINNMRDNRVHEIAHHIAAQALGLKLIPSSRASSRDGKDIYHGEYEPMSGIKPVDMVVMENLSRYLTSVDHSRSENSQLMQWSHRQIVTKVTQILTETYGIPVIFAQPMYSSKFDSLSSKPGFRAVAVKALYEKEIKKCAALANKSLHKLEEAELFLIQKAYYAQLLVKLQENGEKLPTGFALYAPHPSNSGEYFISSSKRGVTLRNADINAACNIAWRALAAPDAYHLLHRIRLVKKSTGIQTRAENKREKSLKKTYSLQTDISKDDAAYLEIKEGNISAFYSAELSGLRSFASLSSETRSISFCLGKEFWGQLKHNRWHYCHLLNKQRLEKAGFLAEAMDIEQRWIK